VSKVSNYYQLLNQIPSSARGIAQGPIAEALGKVGVGGQTGAQVRALEAMRTDIASSLAKAMTGSGRPAASIIEQWKQSIPNVTDPPQVAQQKLNDFMQLIQGSLSAAQIPASQNMSMAQLTGA
jgi:hypothetical protein